MAKKYVSLARLTEYDGLIKAEIAKKANVSHNHDDKYYTQDQVNTKLAEVNTSIDDITSGEVVVEEAKHAQSATTAESCTGNAATATTASKLGTDTVGSTTQPIYLNNGVATEVTKIDIAHGGTNATTAADARTNLGVYSTTDVDTKLSGKSDTSHNHDAKYDVRGAAAEALTSAKTYADNAATKVKNDLLNGAGTAYDTLKELGDLIDNNQDAIEALETVASGKADAVHSHAIADVSGLQSALDGKAASSHGTHVTYDSTNKPKMDGTAAFGTSASVARADHVHPTDTSRASQTALDNLTTVVNGKADSGHGHDAATTSTAGFMTAAMVTKLNGIATGATKVTVDTALSATSTNPVQNKVVNTALNTATQAITANTNSITAHSTAIGNLQTALAEFEEVTPEEIQALFAN